MSIGSDTDEAPGASSSAQLGEIARRRHFDYFLMALFPRGDSAGFADNCVLCNWPDDLVADYAASDAFHRSRLVCELSQTSMPIFRDGNVFARKEAGRGKGEGGDPFIDRGLHATFAFTLHDAALRHYVFAFSGSRADLSPRESMELVYGAMQILEGFARRMAEAERPSERLSRREIECLRWSAAGKSSDEIAVILGLSSHTVASYLKIAMRKLNSVNRMQAVARAFRYRLI